MNDVAGTFGSDSNPTSAVSLFSRQGYVSRPVEPDRAREAQTACPHSGGLVGLEMESRDSLEVLVPSHQNRAVLAGNRRDQEVEIADRMPPPVQIAPQTGGVLRRVSLQRQDFKAASQCEAPLQQSAPPAIAGAEELGQGGCGDCEQLLMALPFNGTVSSSAVPPE